MAGVYITCLIGVLEGIKPYIVPTRFCNRRKYLMQSFILKTKSKVPSYVWKLQASICSFIVQIFEHSNQFVQMLVKGLFGQKKA